MKITNKTKGIKQASSGVYIYKGDLISLENIEIKLDNRFICEGDMISNKNIISRHAISVYGNIEAKLGISSGDDIIAEKNIISSGFIKSGWDIRADYGSIICLGIMAEDYIFAQKNIKVEKGITTVCGGVYSENGSIYAGIGITSGGNITAANEIEAGSRIFAGTHSCSSSEDVINTILCKKLLSGQIAYGELKIRQ